MSLEDELKSMEESLEEPGAGEDDLQTDSPETPTPGTGAPNTPTPGTSTPHTEAPHTEAPAEDPRDKEIRELREKITKMEEKKPPKTSPPGTSTPKTSPPLSDEDFLGEIDLDDLTRDPTLFNKVLNKVYKKGIDLGRTEIKNSLESITRSIPDIARNSVELTARLKEIHDQFYEGNKDLIPWKKAVGLVMEEMISESPEKTFEELMPALATETRRRLGLVKKSDKTDNDPPPSLPRKKGGQRQQPKPDTDPLLSEMDEMDRALGLE